MRRTRKSSGRGRASLDSMTYSSEGSPGSHMRLGEEGDEAAALGVRGIAEEGGDAGCARQVASGTASDIPSSVLAWMNGNSDTSGDDSDSGRQGEELQEHENAPQVRRANHFTSNHDNDDDLSKEIPSRARPGEGQRPSPASANAVGFGGATFQMGGGSWLTRCEGDFNERTRIEGREEGGIHQRQREHQRQQEQELTVPSSRNDCYGGSGGGGDRAVERTSPRADKGNSSSSNSSNKNLKKVGTNSAGAAAAVAARPGGRSATEASVNTASAAAAAAAAAATSTASAIATGTAASTASDIGTATTATATRSASRGTGHFVGRSASKVTVEVAVEQTGENLGRELGAKLSSAVPDMRSWLDDDSDSDSGREAGGALVDGDGGSRGPGRMRSRSRSSGENLECEAGAKAKVTDGVAVEQTGENPGRESGTMSSSAAPNMHSWLDDDSDSGSEAGGTLVDGDGGSREPGRMRSRSRSSGENVGREAEAKATVTGGVAVEQTGENLERGSGARSSSAAPDMHSWLDDDSDSGSGSEAGGALVDGDGGSREPAGRMRSRSRSSGENLGPGAGAKAKVTRGVAVEQTGENLRRESGAISSPAAPNMRSWLDDDRDSGSEAGSDVVDRDGGGREPGRMRSRSRSSGENVAREAGAKAKVTGRGVVEQTGENPGRESGAMSSSAAPDMHSWLDDDSDSGSEAGGTLVDGDGGSREPGRMRSRSRSSGENVGREAEAKATMTGGVAVEQTGENLERGSGAKSSSAAPDMHSWLDNDSDSGSGSEASGALVDRDGGSREPGRLRSRSRSSGNMRT